MITVNGSTLEATPGFLSYQWIDETGNNIAMSAFTDFIGFMVLTLSVMPLFITFGMIMGIIKTELTFGFRTTEAAALDSLTSLMLVVLRWVTLMTMARMT